MGGTSSDISSFVSGCKSNCNSSNFNEIENAVLLESESVGWLMSFWSTHFNFSSSLQFILSVLINAIQCLFDF